MTGHILLAACLLAVCLPILSVQLPRYYHRHHDSHNHPLLPNKSLLLLPQNLFQTLRSILPEPRSTLLLRRAVRKRTSPYSEKKTTTTTQFRFGADASEDRVSIAPTVSAGALRKPWERPFPVRSTRQDGGAGHGVDEVGHKGKKETSGEGMWLDYPHDGSLTPKKKQKTGRDMEDDGVTIRLFPADAVMDVKEREMPREHTVDVSSSTVHAPSVEQDVISHEKSKEKNKEKTASWASASMIQILIAAMAFLLFLLGFAILIAHFLAWFIVYKTEARLGEARRGVLKGGEMRMCLCAR